MSDFKLGKFDCILIVQQAKLQLLTTLNVSIVIERGMRDTYITLGAWWDTVSFILSGSSRAPTARYNIPSRRPAQISRQTNREPEQLYGSVSEKKARRASRMYFPHSSVCQKMTAGVGHVVP